MATTDTVSRGIFSLPNEILLSILSLFPTRSLLPLTTTCYRFHSLILRVIHYRLQVAASLDGYTLYLECYPPSARLIAAKFFCTSQGTSGIEDLMVDNNNELSRIGQVKRVGSLYSRFRPQLQEPDITVVRRHPAGDIPGSRTHPSSNPTQEATGGNDIVTEIVTVDAHDLFSQLTTSAYLGKREMTKGLLFSLQEVCDGTIRVWRDWLSRQCESKKWTDGDTVIVHHDTPSDLALDLGGAGPQPITARSDPRKDPSVLWINTRVANVGIKFRVRERKWQRANPVLYSSDVEVAVDYQVQFEEVFVRTTHLLLKLEEAQQQVDNSTGKAIIFGSFAGLQEFDTAGNPGS